VKWPSELGGVKDPVEVPISDFPILHPSKFAESNLTRLLGNSLIHHLAI